MENDALRFTVRRTAMVRQQLKKRGIRDQEILHAFSTVPREYFVPVSLQEVAYDDRPLPIGHGQTISQPFVVAAMLQMLNLQPEDRVLEVGAGSGYAAALLGQIVAEVYALERIAKLAQRARTRVEWLGYSNVLIAHGDGLEGWAEHAPYDAILVSASGSVVPEALKHQLAVGGRLIIPVGSELQSQRLVLIRRQGEDTFDEKSFGRVAFVPLIEGASDQAPP